MTPDYRPNRLATLKREVAFHQDEQRRVGTDQALTAHLRAMLVTYHAAIIRWLQEQVAAMESC